MSTPIEGLYPTTNRYIKSSTLHIHYRTVSIQPISTFKMQFQTAALILAYAASAALAAPAAATESKTTLSSDYVELFRESAKQSNGHLVYYGPHDGTKNGSVSLQARTDCPTDTAPTCDSDNGAKNDVCTSLYNELVDDPEIGVPESPRQICYNGDGGYCCVSWHSVVPGLVKGDLVPYVQRMLDSCTQNGISGKTYNVNVHETCTDVCLSDRGTHC
jgi:hypothetical protein